MNRYVFLLSPLLLALPAAAQRTDKQMAGCTFLYNNPETARKKLIQFFDTRGQQARSHAG